MQRKHYLIHLEAKFCKSCGLCVGLCPKGVWAIAPDHKAMVVDSDACIGCEACRLHCPDYCIDIMEIKEAENE